MARLYKETKEQIKELDYKDLQDIVISLVSKYKVAYNFVLVKYLDKSGGELELFEATKADLDAIFIKRHKGYATELQTANMLGACINRINEFTNISKNKVYEADLLMYILEVPFSMSTKMFGTCFTQYDNKVATIIKRLINLVTKNLHEDYRVQYESKINEYLNILHTNANYIPSIKNLPDVI